LKIYSFKAQIHAKKVFYETMLIALGYWDTWSTLLDTKSPAVNNRSNNETADLFK